MTAIGKMPKAASRPKKALTKRELEIRRVVNAYIALDRQKKDAERLMEPLKKRLLEFHEKYGIETLNGTSQSITPGKPQVRVTYDMERAVNDHPDHYFDDYRNESKPFYVFRITNRKDV